MMHQAYPTLQNLENESIHSSTLESFGGMANTNAHDAWETSSNGLCSPRIPNQSYGYNHGPSNEETHNSMYSGRGNQQQISNNNRTGSGVPNNIIYPNVYQQQLQIKGQPINKPSGVKFESNYASNVRGHSTSMDSGYANMIQSNQQQNSSTTIPPMDMSSWGNNNNDNTSNRSFDRSQLFTRNDSGSQASQNYISPTISHNYNSPVSLSGKSINNNNNIIVKDINLEEDPMMSNVYFNTTKNTWDCGICRKSFCEKNDLFQHLRSGTHEPKRFSCSDCGKAFASIGALAQHVEQSGHSRGNKTLLQEVDQFGNNAAIAAAAAAASASNFDIRQNINNNNSYKNMTLPMQQQLMQQSQHQSYMNNNLSQVQFDNYIANGGNHNISGSIHHGMNSIPVPAPPMSASRVRFYSGPEFVSHHNHHIPPPPLPPHQQQHSHQYPQQFHGGNYSNINSYATSQSIQNNNNSFMQGNNAGNGYQCNNNNRLNMNNQQIPPEVLSEKSFTHVSQVFNNLKSHSPDRNLLPTDAERRRTISYPDHNLIHNHRPVMPPSSTFYYSNGGVADHNNNSFNYSSTTQRPFMNNNGGINNNAAKKDSLNSSSAFYTIEELEIDIDGLGLNNTNNNNNNYSGNSRVNHGGEDIDGTNDHGEDYYYEMPLTPKSPRLNAANNISCGGISTGNVYKQSPLIAGVGSATSSLNGMMPVVSSINATQSPPLLFEPEYTLYFSGASPHRSLHGVCAYMIRDERNDILVAQGTQPLVQIYAGSMRPEYEGLNLGLTEAYRQGIRRLRVAGDSELVFMHLNTGSELRYCQSVYRVVQDISKQVRMMCCNFHEISFDLIMKEDNKAVPLAVLEMTAAFK